MWLIREVIISLCISTSLSRSLKKSNKQDLATYPSFNPLLTPFPFLDALFNPGAMDVVHWVRDPRALIGLGF